MKRISAIALTTVLALSTITTKSEAIEPTTTFIGAAALYVGTLLGKKWEREDPRRNRLVVQPVNNQPTQEYVNGPVGSYYYQPTTYAYEPQRVVIRDAY
jgi:hypothetical protein